MAQTCQTRTPSRAETVLTSETALAVQRNVQEAYLFTCNERHAEMNTPEFSPRSRLVALLFCVFLGVFGVHRFYVGKIGTGILMLVTLGGLGIWNLIDLILIAVGSFRDKEDR